MYSIIKGNILLVEGIYSFWVGYTQYSWKQLTQHRHLHIQYTVRKVIQISAIEHDTKLNIPRSTVSRFPRYISCYIVENRFSLGKLSSVVTAWNADQKEASSGLYSILLFLLYFKSEVCGFESRDQLIDTILSTLKQ